MNVTAIESEKCFFDNILYSTDVSFNFEDFIMTLLDQRLNLITSVQTRIEHLSYTRE